MFARRISPLDIILSMVIFCMSCVDKKGLLHTQRVSTFSRGPRGIGLIKVEFWMKAESMRAAVSGAVPSVEPGERKQPSQITILVWCRGRGW